MLWQAATAIFSPLFIHLLSHLALLVILALTLNQIYHTVSAFIFFPVASQCFYFQVVFFFYLSPLVLCCFFSYLFIFKQISSEQPSDDQWSNLGHDFHL